MGFGTDRDVDTDGDQHRGYKSWELVGECYVDGIMEGDLMEVDECGEYRVRGSLVSDFLIV